MTSSMQLKAVMSRTVSRMIHRSISSSSGRQCREFFCAPNSTGLIPLPLTISSASVSFLSPNNTVNFPIFICASNVSSADICIPGLSTSRSWDDATDCGMSQPPAVIGLELKLIGLEPKSRVRMLMRNCKVNFIRMDRIVVARERGSCGRTRCRPKMIVWNPKMQRT